MRLLNCMWSAEPAFKSVHLVLSHFIAAVAPTQQANIFLMGDASQQNLLVQAESFQSKKKATKKLIATYFLRRKWLGKIQEFNPDVVVVDGLGMARLLLPVLEKYHSARVLIYFHGQTKFTAKDVALLTRHYKFSLKLIAVSQTLATNISHLLPHLDVLAIPTYLDLPNKVSQPKTESSTVVLGAVGRLVDDKNFAVLLECMSQLVAKGLPVSLIIAGEGKCRQALENQITQLGLSQQVTLLGQVDDMDAFYQGIDLLLVPSQQEGQGLVIQEAIHYGKPVICSDLAVFKEQLSDSGVYCASGEVGQWSQACELYMSTEARLQLFERQQIQHQSYNTAQLFAQRCVAACL